MSSEEEGIPAHEATLLAAISLSSTLRGDTSDFIEKQSDNVRQGEDKRNRLFMENSNYHQPHGYMEADDVAAVVVPSLEFFEIDKNIKKTTSLVAGGPSLREVENTTKTGLPDVSKQFISAASFEGQKITISLQGKLSTLNEIEQQTTPISKKQQMNHSEDHYYEPTNKIGRACSFPTSPEPKRKRKQPSTLGRFFQVLYFVNSFIFQMKKILLFFRPQQLNSLQLGLIADNAAHQFEQDVFGVPYPIAKDATSQYGTTLEKEPQFLQQQQQIQSFHRNSISATLMGTMKQKSLLAMSKSPEPNKRLQKFLKRMSKSSMYLFLSRCKRKSLNFIKRVLRNTLHKMPLIDPTSGLFRLWELIIFMCDTINLIYIPFRLSFITIDIFEIYFYRITFPAIYSLNILFNMNVSVYSRGILIVSRQKVISMYFRSIFILDVLPLGGQYIHPVLYLSRLLYSNPTLEQLKSFLLLNSKLNAVQQFISLSIKTLIFGHFFSCAWHLVGKYNAENLEGWMIPLNIITQPIPQRYITCFYYAVVTMSTIGYGEITATTTNERVLMIFSIFFASGLYGYTLNAIGTILSNLKNQSENYSKKQAQLEEYLDLHDVDIGLRNRARKYIEYAQEQENMLKRDGQENLNLLNSILKEEIQKDINKKVLLKARGLFSIISSNVKFFERLQGIVKEQTFGPEEIIYIQNSAQPPALYIIAYGEVELFLKKREHLNSLKVLQSLKTGCIFGQYEFFTNNQSNCLSARSVGVTYISSISLEEFQQLLLEFQEEKERFYNIRDQILTNQANHLIKLNCLSCLSDKHTIQSCPYLFYDPIQRNHEQILLLAKKLSDEDITLNRCNIRKRNRFSTTSQKNSIQKEVEIFQMQKKEEIAALLNHIFPFQDEEQENFEGSLIIGLDQSVKEDTCISNEKQQNNNNNNNNNVFTLNICNLDNDSQGGNNKQKQSTFSKDVTNKPGMGKGFAQPTKYQFEGVTNNNQWNQLADSPVLLHPMSNILRQSQDRFSDNNNSISRIESELSPSIKRKDNDESNNNNNIKSQNNNINNNSNQYNSPNGKDQIINNRPSNKSLTSINQQQQRSLTVIDNEQPSGIISNALNQQQTKAPSAEYQMIQQLQMQIQQLQIKQDILHNIPPFRAPSPQQQQQTFGRQLSFQHQVSSNSLQSNDPKAIVIPSNTNNQKNYNPISLSPNPMQQPQQQQQLQQWQKMSSIQLSPSSSHRQINLQQLTTQTNNNNYLMSLVNPQISYFQRANSKKQSIAQVSQYGQGQSAAVAVTTGGGEYPVAVLSPRRAGQQIIQLPGMMMPSGNKNSYFSKDRQTVEDNDILSLKDRVPVAFDEGQNDSLNQQNEIYSWESLGDCCFEQLRNYQVYFPHNNFDAIAIKWNDILKQKTFKRSLKRTKKPYYSNIKQQSSTPQSKGRMKESKIIKNNIAVQQFE